MAKDAPFRRLGLERRRRVSWGGIDTWVVSLEDLVLSKLVWAREGDSELQRKDVTLLLKQQPDRAYLDEWASKLGVAALLQELQTR